MADVKWIKLSTDVFNNEKFDAIRTMPDSKDIMIAWIELLCLAGKCNENGFLLVARELPYTDEMLAQHFRMDVGTVQRALSVFQTLGMVEVVDNIYMVSNWTRYQSSDRLEEIRRKDRERKREAKKQAELTVKGEEETDSTENSMEIPRKFHGDCSLFLTLNSNNSIPSNSLNNNSNNSSNTKDSSNTKKSSNKLEVLVKESKLSEPVQDKLIEYIKYRSEIKKPIKTERSFKSTIKKAEESEQIHGSIAVIECIDDTIRNEWQGLFFNNIGTGNKGRQSNGKKPLEQQFEDMNAW